MSAILKNVGIELIDSNPFRCLSEYPWIENKIEALQRSITDVGFWEGVIVRKKGKRYQMAFGHHRLEAAKRNGLTMIPVIHRELTDEQMLQFMGRENGEDYSTDFLTMLNTWEGAMQFRAPGPVIVQAIDIAELLGWTEARKEGGRDKANKIAMACHSAHQLIIDNYMNRDDLIGLSVKQAREIVGRANVRMDQLDRMAQTTNRPKKEVEAVKRQVAKGATMAAKSARKGDVLTKDLRSEVDAQTYKVAARSKVKDSPLFEIFGKALSDSLEKMLSSDAAATKLQSILDALPNITMEVDAAMVRRINFDLNELSKRANAWQTKLTLNKVQQVRFPMLEGGKK